MKSFVEQRQCCQAHAKYIRNMVLPVFKCLHFGKYPKYLKDIFNLQSITYSLRGTDILSLPEYVKLPMVLIPIVIWQPNPGTQFQITTAPQPISTPFANFFQSESYNNIA